MSWIRKTDKPWYHRLCLSALKTGPIPKHVAFIMDGNRRFAKKNSLQKSEGHLKGFDKLAQTLEWCMDLGIAEVTVYAFSIENFKRSKEEVDCLMELAKQKFQKLLEEREVLEKHKICVRLVGNLSLVPPDVLSVIAEAVNLTKDHTSAVLNVCFAYTSRDEITQAVVSIAEGVKNELILESDVSERLLAQCLYTSKSPDPDLLVRTSGEVRLSDFLLWQSSYSALSFVKVLWPDFTIWHLYGGILNYQRNFSALQEARERRDLELRNEELDADKRTVQDMYPNYSEETLDDYLIRYRSEKQDRISNFLSSLELKRSKFWTEAQSLVKR